MTWSFWIIAAIVLLIIEIATPGVFFFACLSVGAFFGGITALFNLPYWAPWIVFLFVSILSIYLIRPFARKMFAVNKPEKSNVDALIGQKALTTEAINPPHLGLVKVEGELWRAEAREAIEAGTCVEITGVNGTRLIVKRLGTDECPY